MAHAKQWMKVFALRNPPVNIIQLLSEGTNFLYLLQTHSPNSLICTMNEMSARSLILDQADTERCNFDTKVTLNEVGDS